MMKMFFSFILSVFFTVSLYAYSENFDLYNVHTLPGDITTSGITYSSSGAMEVSDSFNTLGIGTISGNALQLIVVEPNILTLDFHSPQSNVSFEITTDGTSIPGPHSVRMTGYNESTKVYTYETTSLDSAHGSTIISKAGTVTRVSIEVLENVKFAIDNLITIGVPVSSCAYTPNVIGKTLSLVNMKTNRVIKTIPLTEKMPWGILFSNFLSRLYVAVYDLNSSSNDAILVINTNTNTIIAEIEVGSSPVGLALTPDKSRLYVGNGDNDNLMVIDTATNTVIGSPIGVGNYPVSISSHPVKDLIYVVNNYAGSISEVNTTTNSVTNTIMIGQKPYEGHLTSDGSKLYVPNSQSNTVSVINTNTLAVTSIAVGNSPKALAISPDDHRVYVTNYDDGTVSVIDTATDTVLGSPIAVGNHAWGIEVSPDGTQIYVLNFRNNTEFDNKVYVLNTGNNTIIKTIEVGVGPTALGTFTGGTCHNSSNPALIMYLLN